MKDKRKWNKDPEYLVRLIKEYYQWMITASTHNYNNTQVLVDAYEIFFSGQLSDSDDKLD